MAPRRPRPRSNGRTVRIAPPHAAPTARRAAPPRSIGARRVEKSGGSFPVLLTVEWVEGVRRTGFELGEQVVFLRRPFTGLKMSVYDSNKRRALGAVQKVLHGIPCGWLGDGLEPREFRRRLFRRYGRKNPAGVRHDGGG